MTSVRVRIHHQKGQQPSYLGHIFQGDRLLAVVSGRTELETSRQAEVWLNQQLSPALM
ncbi:hypothetical protein [Synechococcus elongatus]|uniref:Uncharacterized protein n=1 Tax=Synechococcus elongatus (strain ATCC 33912 / PCC 7942 / FACHB-805) TaxID=1140 RepID=Q31KQ3_SYNE7|nr:hypothetical protein [Synechococcus elongatus]ABB58366.1 hypothetical protein Synpcc7942_2336 [Synechococcus elongatus PCC 7942 = FACHB-805]MBD2587088.1 hypothetical protein [Synechococcus elongatus FACHB-242]MBD2688159.1 hypothetical protein [Synechococcus elongatus FACHB-1061]MBD2706130.1 hypothetical protein [Synechococcus elongatus PCC 7942 = FACHB-805]WKW05315.1 hypothetical protein QY054_12115 [Synechococcus elongatus PCC 7942 = FACHB-805]